MTRICVVGLGKIGLPLAVQCVSKGHRVVGVDIDARVVSAVSSGAAPFPGEPGLDARVGDAVASGLLSVSLDVESSVSDSEVILVAVPLGVDALRRPDYGTIDKATESIGRGLRRGALVCFETTLPVGATRHHVSPMLETVSGLEEGRDFFTCHSPERVLCGSVFADLRRYPKLVGALGPEGLRRAADFYRSVLDFDERSDLPRPNGVWEMAAAEASEFTKLAETSFRNLNIAFANELTKSADALDLDVHELIEAANSQPYSHIHQPGVAVGGHCIPVYPHLLVDSATHTAVLRKGIAVNDTMPEYTLDVLESLIGSLDGLRVVILGAAYRGGVKELSCSGVFPLAAGLDRRGATVAVHDPLYEDRELKEVGLSPFQLGNRCDAAIVQADHRAYRDLSPDDLPGIRAIVDGRRVLDDAQFRGVAFRRLGSPARRPS